jgi:hypothetical protein
LSIDPVQGWNVLEGGGVRRGAAIGSATLLVEGHHGFRAGGFAFTP